MNWSLSVTKTLLLLWIATLATTSKKNKFVALANPLAACPSYDESSCKGDPGCSWVVTKKRIRISEKCIESPKQKVCSRIRYSKKKKLALMTRPATTQEHRIKKRKQKKCNELGCVWKQESLSCLTQLTKPPPDKKDDKKSDEDFSPSPEVSDIDKKDFIEPKPTPEPTILAKTSCSERASCYDCLYGKGSADNNDSCSFVAETGRCYNSCSPNEVPMDVSCFEGLMSKDDARSACASIDQDRKNAQLCKSKSHINCLECTKTKIIALERDGTKKGGTCQWFKLPDDSFTIGGSGGYCASECNFNGCGTTTCDSDKPEKPTPPPKPTLPPKDDSDKINSKLCGSKTRCNSCTDTKIKTIDGPSTCKWFPPTDDDADNDECAGNGFCSHECIDGDCGVTDLGTKDVCALPKPGTVFVKYFNSKFLLNRHVADKAKVELLNLYPGLDVQIIEDGSPVTKDYRINRVRIFVEKKKDGKMELCKRYVIAAPRVG